jgi:hypothetical protein
MTNTRVKILTGRVCSRIKFYDANLVDTAAITRSFFH